jgi:hypothetical protein
MIHSKSRAILRRATAVWLVVSAVASVYYLVCFAVPQLTTPPGIAGITCLSGPYHSSEDQRRESQECADAMRRGALQLERRKGILGMLVFGSMVVVSAVLLRRERKRDAV